MYERTIRTHVTSSSDAVSGVAIASARGQEKGRVRDKGRQVPGGSAAARLFPRLAESIPDPAHRLNPAGRRPQLLAQGRDVNVDRAVRDRHAVAEGVVDELIAIEHAAACILTFGAIDDKVGQIRGRALLIRALVLRQNLLAATQLDLELRADLEAFRSTGKSLMPEGMEQKLTPQDAADLVAFLLGRK